MTATASPSTASSSGPAAGRRRIWPWILLAGALVGIALLAGGSSDDDRSFDPASTKPYGTKALVELVSHFGADVKVTTDLPDDDTDVAVVFPGSVPGERIDALKAWVARGHTLVVADPRSDLNAVASGHSVLVDTFTEPLLERGECTIGALDNARVIKVGDEGSISTARGFPVPDRGGVCFTKPSETGNTTVAALVAVPEGRGTIVSVGAPEIFVNNLLDEADNSVVANDLLAPTRGTKVAILQRPPGSAADPSLGDLLSIGVKLGIIQLLIAFAFYAVARGRRLGKPVLELQPVQIPGSELVSAVGNLLQQTSSPDRAATVLRADVRRRLCERLGLPIEASPDVIAASIEARVGVEQETTLPLLSDLPCPTEPALLDLAAALDDLRRHVLGGA